MQGKGGGGVPGVLGEGLFSLGIAANGSDWRKHETLLSAVVLRNAPHDFDQVCGEAVHVPWD